MGYLADLSRWDRLARPTRRELGALLEAFHADLRFERLEHVFLGEVSHGDLLRWALGSAALVLLLNAYLAWALTPWLLLIAAADLLYGAFLLKLEQWSRAVNERMLLNLAVTYPVNMALQGYVYVFFVFAYAATPAARDALLVLAFVLVFLHYEFARKTAWPELTEPGAAGPSGMILYSVGTGRQGKTKLSCILLFVRQKEMTQVARALIDHSISQHSASYMEAKVNSAP